MQNIKIFLASPSDVTDERNTVTDVVEDLQLTLGKSKSVHIELIKWETHVNPSIGIDAQDVINNQIGEYSIFVGVMWNRFGAKTKRAESGTEEEFSRAYELFIRDGKPKILFYFRDPIALRTLDELKQLEKLFKFKKKLSNAGTLYHQYSNIRNFERNLHVHLYREIEKMLDSKSLPQTATAAIQPDYKPQIFLSHRSQDREFVEKIYRILSQMGLKPWMSGFDISLGEKWQDEIKSAISKSKLFVRFISKSESEPSATGFSTNTESRIAKSLTSFQSSEASEAKYIAGIKIIPVLIDSVPIPDDLKDTQYYDLTDRSKIISFCEEIKRMSERVKNNI